MLDSIDYYNYRVKGFVDEFCEETEHFGYLILWKKIEDINEPEKYFYCIAIGNNERPAMKSQAYISKEFFTDIEEKKGNFNKAP